MGSRSGDCEFESYWTCGIFQLFFLKARNAMGPVGRLAPQSPTVAAGKIFIGIELGRRKSTLVLSWAEKKFVLV